MAQTDAHSLQDIKTADGGSGIDPASSPGAQAQQEKAAIDAGLTGDKIAHNDIATSPLGTDDEAGGGAPQPVQVQQAPKPTENTARDPDRSNESALKFPPWLWVIVALAAAAVLGFVLLGAL